MADGPAAEERVMASACLETEALPSSVLIAPWGEVRSANGTFVVDEEAARLVLEAFGAQGTEIPIDYEHQSLGGVYASPSGQAPAAGWIRSLRAVRPEEAGDGEAGLIAEVAWTAPAREKLAAREYRYLSPVVLVRRRDRRVVALHSAALTNKPAIVGARPIVNRCEAGSVEREAGAQESAFAAAGEALELLRMRLGLPAEADAAVVLASAERRLAALAQEAAAVEAMRKVSAAVAAGKLAPSQRGWAESLALKDPAAFDAFVATAVPIVRLGRTEAPAGASGGGRDRLAVAASARAAWRAAPALELITTEGAWIAQALREAGFEPADGEAGRS